MEQRDIEKFELIKRMPQHPGKKKLLCYVSSCWKQFKSEKARRAHLRCSHPEEYKRRKENNWWSES